MFNFFKGLLGYYKGYQRTTPQIAITKKTTVPLVDNVMQIPGVWCCVNKIVNTMAALPCDVLKVDQNGRITPDKDSHLSFLLQERPNALMTPFEFFRTMTLYYLIYGNAFARIERAKGANYVASLYPLNPTQMKVKVENNQIIYQYYNIDDRIEEIPSKNILHWKNLGNGITGLSLTDFAKATLTEAISAQNAAVDMFENKGKQNGILTTDSIVNSKQKEEIAKAFNNIRNGEGIGVIPASMKFQSFNLSPADTQLLETREFIVKEFCRWFSIPYQLVQGDNGTDFDGMNAYFYKNTILPMCTNLEQLMLSKVAMDEKKDHIIRFRLAFLNRANDQQRADINAKYVQNGIKTRNEVRREEGWEDIEGADELTAQTNLMPVSQLGTQSGNQSQTPLSTSPIAQ